MVDDKCQVAAIQGKNRKEVMDGSDISRLRKQKGTGVFKRKRKQYHDSVRNSTQK